MKRSYLIAYDVTDDRRLGQICRYLKKRAFHIQYSVFLAELTPPQLADLSYELEHLIDEQTDDLRIYPVPRNAAVYCLGRAFLPDGMHLEGGLNQEFFSSHDDIPD